jgi:phosphoglycerate dehydrogenase-like enzyme
MQPPLHRHRHRFVHTPSACDSPQCRDGESIGEPTTSQHRLNIGICAVSRAAAWSLPAHYVDQLRREFPQHTFIEAWDRETSGAVLQRSDAVLTASLDSHLIPSLTRLRWVQATATGVSHILSPELAASPITLTSARGIRARAIAEHIMLMALALARQLPLVLRRQAERIWALDEIEAAHTIRTLRGARMGIVGLGSIGTEVARMAAAFGLQVSATRRRAYTPAPDYVDCVLPSDRLPELLSNSDIIVIAAALTPDTRLLIGRSVLEYVKRGALLINVSRGRLVDDAAIIEALDDGRLGGAALDVFTREPLAPSSPYWHLRNVIVTPHIAGAMEDYWTPLITLFSENLRRFERGERLVNVVDKLIGY